MREFIGLGIALRRHPQSNGAQAPVIEIMRLDLSKDIGNEIPEAGLAVAESLYVAWRLEEMNLFKVVDKIVDLFLSGLLSLDHGSVGHRLHEYWKNSEARMSEVARHDLYTRVFGAPGGSPSAEPNREFNRLWLNFVSAVSASAHRLRSPHRAHAGDSAWICQEPIRSASLALAADLSCHCDGIVHLAAIELNQTVRNCTSMLNDHELQRAFGAGDMWQVIEQVSVGYLGGARDTTAGRVRATAGATILRWLARNLARCKHGDHPAIRTEEGAGVAWHAARGGAPLADPTDGELVDACEAWLAVAGTSGPNSHQDAQA